MEVGDIKNLGPFSIRRPLPIYYNEEGDLVAKDIQLEAAMTYKEAVKVAEDHYPGWRLPNAKEFSYIHSLYQMGITGLKDNYYWVETDQGRDQKVFFNPMVKFITQAFGMLQGGNKLMVILIKNNW
jgi:hypothetical protein